MKRSKGYRPCLNRLLCKCYMFYFVAKLEYDIVLFRWCDNIFSKTAVICLWCDKIFSETSVIYVKITFISPVLYKFNIWSHFVQNGVYDTTNPCSTGLFLRTQIKLWFALFTVTQACTRYTRQYMVENINDLSFKRNSTGLGVVGGEADYSDLFWWMCEGLDLKPLSNLEVTFSQNIHRGGHDPDTPPN